MGRPRFYITLPTLSRFSNPLPNPYVFSESHRYLHVTYIQRGFFFFGRRAPAALDLYEACSRRYSHRMAWYLAAVARSFLITHHEALVNKKTYMYQTTMITTALAALWTCLGLDGSQLKRRTRVEINGAKSVDSIVFDAGDFEGLHVHDEAAALGKKESAHEPDYKI